MSRGLKNCNPGNIRISTTKWIGEIAKTTHRVIYPVFAKKCKFRLPMCQILKTKRLCVLLRLQLVRLRMQRPLLWQTLKRAGIYFNN